jgi:hypothetical protein
MARSRAWCYNSLLTHADNFVSVSPILLRELPRSATGGTHGIGKLVSCRPSVAISNASIRLLRGDCQLLLSVVHGYPAGNGGQRERLPGLSGIQFPHELAPTPDGGEQCDNLWRRVKGTRQADPITCLIRYVTPRDGTGVAPSGCPFTH